MKVGGSRGAYITCANAETSFSKKNYYDRSNRCTMHADAVGEGRKKGEGWESRQKWGELHFRHLSASAGTLSRYSRRRSGAEEVATVRVRAGSHFFVQKLCELLQNGSCSVTRRTLAALSRQGASQHV